MIIPDDMLPHVAKVWTGEYQIPFEKEDCTVLDIGANVGSFAFWALNRWKKSRISCYEPLPENAALLAQNLERWNGRWLVYEAAVSRETRKDVPLYLGLHNSGEGSLFKDTDQKDESVLVTTVDAATLPYHDIVKIDCEGSEMDVVGRLLFKPVVYMIEYHGAARRRALEDLLSPDYHLIGHSLNTIHTGVVKYLRKDQL